MPAGLSLALAAAVDESIGVSAANVAINEDNIVDQWRSSCGWPAAEPMP